MVIFTGQFCPFLKTEERTGNFEFAGLTRADLLALLLTINHPFARLFKMDMARWVFGFFMGLTLANLLAWLLPRLTRSLAVL